MKKFADNIFTFCVGSYLITAATLNVEIPGLLYWLMVICVVIAAAISIITFGGFGVFFASVPNHLDTFGPGGAQNEFAVATLKIASEAADDYRTPSVFYLSFMGSLILMAGLLLQGWYVILTFEVLGSAVGYGFIHYFHTNRPTIRENILGPNETAA